MQKQPTTRHPRLRTRDIELPFLKPLVYDPALQRLQRIYRHLAAPSAARFHPGMATKPY